MSFGITSKNAVRKGARTLLEQTHNNSINYAPAVPDAAKLRRLLRRYTP